MPDENNNQADTATLTDHSDAAGAVAAERDQLIREKAELQDLLLRRQAEFENFRRRAERERMEFAEYASMDAVRSLLPVVDDFERALKAASLSGAAAEFVQGVELICQRMLDTFKRLGLEPIASVGEKFDPHLHHAVEMSPNPDLEEQTILEEYQRGYNFKGRLLRPAMVKVAVKP